ncbi:nitrate reductase cytochrome c-type subunit [Endothiovibrio diazotrophicus]
MRQILCVAAAALLTLVLGEGRAAAEEVTSLRGEQALEVDGSAIVKKKQVTRAGGFGRAFELQPPMIPHGIGKDRITLQVNTCLRCHSAANYEKEKAPKIGDSHFFDRDGQVHKELSKRRWFCEQCHAPQMDAPPLVENTF